MNSPLLFSLACFLFGASFSAASASTGVWFFLPCGTHPHAEIAKLSPAEFATRTAPGSAERRLGIASSSTVPKGTSRKASPFPPLRWLPARFPHAEFDRIQPQNNVFGWYGCLVTIPEPLQGHDLVLDLGVIDDADIAYVNGVNVGNMGSFEEVGKSGWCRDRRYRVPAKLVKPGPNLVLVQVKDFWGLGGMVGPPVVGAALVPSDAKWKVTQPSRLPVASETLAPPLGPSTGKMPVPPLKPAPLLDLLHLNTLAHVPPLPTAGWTEVPIPDTGWDARQKQDNVYGLYRLRFTLPRTQAKELARSLGDAFKVAQPSRLRITGETPAPPLGPSPGKMPGPLSNPPLPGPVLDLGPVFDVAAVFLNGVRIAQLGRFPEPGLPAFVQTAKRLRFFVPLKALHADGKPNDLVVLVYNTVQRGGLPGIPVWVRQPLARAEFAPEVNANLELTDLFAAAGDFSSAWTCIDALAAVKRSPAEDAAFKSKQVWLCWLEAQVNPNVRSMRIPQALGVFQALLARHRNETVSQNAMQAFCAILEQARTAPELRATVLDFFPKLDIMARPSRLPIAGETPAPDSSTSRPQVPSSAGGGMGRGGLEGVRDSLRQGPGRRPASASASPASAPSSTPLPGPVLYLGPDRTTRGDWVMYYGSDTWVLAAMGQITDWFGGPHQVRRQLSIPGDKDKPREWLNPGARAIDDVRALLMPTRYDKHLAKAPAPSLDNMRGPLLPGVPVRRASWWDDHGEQHAFDEQGPDLCVRIAVPKGDHLLSFYVLDHDWQGTWHPRQQSMMLFDDQDRLLSSVWTGKFGQGVYERFLVRGPLDLTTRFFKNRSACIACSGFFLDRVRPLPRFAHLQPVVPRSKRSKFPEWSEAWDRLAGLSEDNASRVSAPASSSASSSSTLSTAVFWPYSTEADRLVQELTRTADTDARARLALVCLSTARADWAPARTALVRGLRAETEVRAVGAFLTALLEQRASLEWCYLAACRYIELADKVSAARVRRDLERAILACSGPPTYPICCWLFQQWHNRKFPMTRTLAEKERVSAEYAGLRAPRKMDPRAQAWFDSLKKKQNGRTRTRKVRKAHGEWPPTPERRK